MRTPLTAVGMATIAVFLFGSQAMAQTCGCAGAPLLSSQSISSASKGNLLVGFTYEFDNIDGLFSGTEKLDNRTVRRNTQVGMLETHYGITDRLTLSGTFTLIDKRRETGLQNPGSSNIVNTNGIGDGLFLLKYVLHKNTIRAQYQLAVGGGVKVPFGSFSHTNSGLSLNADMQPGTGAWDGVFWSYLSKTFAPHTKLNLFWTNSFRLTGKSDRFSNTNDSYKFGNEWVSTLGAGNQLIGNFSYVLQVEYRSISTFERAGADVPNTGGKWINFKPAVSYSLTNELSFRISSELPLYRDLNGTQSTTTYAISGSIYYNFKGKTIF